MEMKVMHSPRQPTDLTRYLYVYICTQEIVKLQKFSMSIDAVFEWYMLVYEYSNEHKNCREKTTKKRTQLNKDNDIFPLLYDFIRFYI